MRRPSKHRRTTPNSGANDSIVLPDLGSAEEARSFWAGLKTEVNADDELLAWTKNLYRSGLTKLESQGRYHPRVLESLVNVQMIRLFENPDDDALAEETDLLGYFVSGHRSDDPHKVLGRYINVRAFADTSTAIHELSHVTFDLGDPEKEHILVEPIVNRAALDIMGVMGETSDLSKDYQPHDRVLGMIMHASRLSFYDITYISSGPDPVENEQVLRQVVIDRTGSDYVGYAQNQYLTYIDQSKVANPEGEPDIYAAARGVERDLAYYLSPSQPAYAAV